MIDRIRTEYDVAAMVALDTFELIETRVRKLLSYDRRISMTQRYTYLERAPELQVGLTVERTADGDRIISSRDDTQAHFSVLLKPGIMSGFGFSAYASDGNDTEAEAWRRYHAQKATSPDYFQRRRRMTMIRLVGGREMDESFGSEDLIVISAWNSDGVCDERVIRFDPGTY